MDMDANTSESSVTVVNVDFLRSGRYFVSDSSSNVDAAEERPRSHSLNEKLSKYYDETLSAVDCAIKDEKVTRDFKVAKSEPKSIVNVNFLRSGAEFSNIEQQPHDDLAGRTMSSNEKLNRYYEKTQAAAARAAQRAHTDPVVNLDFLKSGKQFQDAAPSSPASTRSVKTSNTRLDDFYNRTAAAMANAVRSGALPMNR